VFADLGKDLLAIEEAADKRAESKLHLVLFACVCRH
jgi:hypothetical protein